MTVAGGGTRTPIADADEQGAGQVSFLDQALWRRLTEEASQEQFVAAWLALQCRLLDGAVRGVAVLEDPESKKFVPAGYWPDASAADPSLAAAVDLALKERRGVVHGGDQSADIAAGTPIRAAYPFIVEGHLYGVVGIELQSSGPQQVRSIMRQLRWGTAWIEVLLRRERNRSDSSKLDRTGAALEFVGTALAEDGFDASCHAIVSELARRLDCDQVAIGFRRGRHTRVASLSDATQFGARMNLVRDIGIAMDEAIDQREAVLFPPPGGGGDRITRAHAELARAHGIKEILTVPMLSSGEFVGAVSFEMSGNRGFDPDTVELCDCVAAVLGPLLEVKRREDRWVLLKVRDSIHRQIARLIGPRFFGRKIAIVLAAAVVAFFYYFEHDFRLTSPASIEGLVQRAIVAPFDGYVATERARAGETVKKGALLATLDDKDLALERLRWSTVRRQRITEYNRALAARGRADINIIRAQIEQANAQIALLDAQLKRTRLMAPFDGLVVSGDLSQSIGSAVQRGQELFTIAPLAQYRVIIEVGEADIRNVRLGQKGTLLVASLPKSPLRYEIERITPISEAKEGRSFFRVEARLLEANEQLRPGMEGVGKTEVDRRRLVWIWTHSLIDWARLQLWTWWP